MNFRRGRREDVPEINLIPFIDILLVVVIFLAVSTTYARFAELKINLPSAGAPTDAAEQPRRIDIAVTSDGRYQINNEALPSGEVERLVAVLKRQAGGRDDVLVVVNADGTATHQSVVNVMEAARQAGLARLTFATQTSASQTASDGQTGE
jgi:biopolymer transport protein ExbD